MWGKHTQAQEKHYDQSFGQPGVFDYNSHSSYNSWLGLDDVIVN